MTLHFAQLAIAIIAGGASIMIVAALVFEAVHGKEQNRRTEAEVGGAETVSAGFSTPLIGKSEKIAVAGNRRGQKARKSGANDRVSRRRLHRRRQKRQERNRPRQTADESQPAATEDA